MGEYLSVKEAAAKWGVSERRVNQFCAEGRIKGARKLGGVWAIPAEADKPSDPRRKKAPAAQAAAPARSTVLMPLMNTPFEPGCCTACIRAMEAGPGREIAWAEYYYFSGQPEKAIRATEPFLTDEDLGLQLSACWIYAYANLSVGQIQRAKFALSQVQKTLTAGAEKTPQLRAAEAFVAAGAAVLLHLPVPKDLPPTADFLPLLPPGPRAFALYIQAHYLYLQQEYGKSVGIVEATLAMGAEQYPISAIYLHLVAVMDYMSLRQPERARVHLLSAWDLARPDDLIEGFGEHHGLLGGMLEAVLKQDFPEDFKRIIAITYRFSSGWRRVHNPETGHDVADNLTTTEFAAAMLAARGWTNQEIGDHMNISPNTVKRYISQVLKKLNIEHRQDLKQHMLQ
ncbi:LuxR C-terminal-related transcriptional regulator [Dysosmobacter sp.]|jgi:DNA-binding CsgD family transcriptional regulator|uniref:LuxR C-terminal-related transcriptional regulator n=1 Tax=Dysosmobacter sp. TaxID=2591382 RepID=UPI003D93EA35